MHWQCWLVVCTRTRQAQHSTTAGTVCAGDCHYCTFWHLFAFACPFGWTQKLCWSTALFLASFAGVRGASWPTVARSSAANPHSKSGKFSRRFRLGSLETLECFLLFSALMLVVSPLTMRIAPALRIRCLLRWMKVGLSSVVCLPGLGCGTTCRMRFLSCWKITLPPSSGCFVAELNLLKVEDSPKVPLRRRCALLFFLAKRWQNLPIQVTSLKFRLSQTLRSYYLDFQH